MAFQSPYSGIGGTLFMRLIEQQRVADQQAKAEALAQQQLDRQQASEMQQRALAEREMALKETTARSDRHLKLAEQQGKLLGFLRGADAVAPEYGHGGQQEMGETGILEGLVERRQAEQPPNSGLSLDDRMRLQENAARLRPPRAPSRPGRDVEGEAQYKDLSDLLQDETGFLNATSLNSKDFGMFQSKDAKSAILRRKAMSALRQHMNQRLGEVGFRAAAGETNAIMRDGKKLQALIGRYEGQDLTFTGSRSTAPTSAADITNEQVLQWAGAAQRAGQDMPSYIRRMVPELSDSDIAEIVRRAPAAQ